MIDENLPTFYLKPSKDSVNHDATLYLAQYGSEASPTYTLRHPDPASPTAKNRYAAALCDCYNPDILFGEVLLIPEWKQVSSEEVRLNGGVPPPPQPILPTEFTVQLYNPDQQVVVRQRSSAWNQFWDFEMPQQTFRQPSSSSLDRTQDDPTISEATPKIAFRWKRDSKITKDLICNLSGRSRNPDGSKKKHKEPDIPMAFFRHLREMTVYEPNLHRVDMEDPKGFEVVLLLSAAVIRDVYFRNLRETFNITDVGPTSSGVRPRQSSNTTRLPIRTTLSPQPQNQRPSSSSSSRPPPTDPRSQWELDAETARLRAQVEAEERARVHLEHQNARRTKRMLKDEEEVERKRQAEIERETERLRKEFEAEQKRLGKAGGQIPPLPPRFATPSFGQGQGQGAYLYPPEARPAYYGGPPPPNLAYQQSQPQGQPSEQRVKPRKSGFFGLRGGGDDGGKVIKKPSAIF